MIKSFTLFGITDVGQQRSHNEDNFVVASDIAANEWGFKRDALVKAGSAGALMVVADGMGGTNAGEVASHLAQEFVLQAFQNLTDIPQSTAERETLLKNCIINAHNKIVEHQHSNLDTAGMGTTLVIAWVIGDQLHTAWSGDSRCYVYDGKTPLLPFTDDHSMVWDLVKKGSLTSEEARTHPESNLILQSLGSPDNPPKPSSRSTTLHKGYRVLVCSDGLNGMLPDRRIEQLLAEGKGTADTCADLVQQANMAGGEDNITCLLLDVIDAGESPVAMSPPQGESSSPTIKNISPEEKKPGKFYYLAAVIVILLGLLMYLYLRPSPQPVPVDPAFDQSEPSQPEDNSLPDSGLNENPSQTVPADTEQPSSTTQSVQREPVSTGTTQESTSQAGSSQRQPGQSEGSQSQPSESQPVQPQPTQQETAPTQPIRPETQPEVKPEEQEQTESEPPAIRLPEPRPATETKPEPRPEPRPEPAPKPVPPSTDEPQAEPDPDPKEEPAEVSTPDSRKSGSLQSGSVMLSLHYQSPTIKPPAQL